MTVFKKLAFLFEILKFLIFFCPSQSLGQFLKSPFLVFAVSLCGQFSVFRGDYPRRLSEETIRGDYPKETIRRRLSEGDYPRRLFEGDYSKEWRTRYFLEWRTRYFLIELDD